MFTVYAETILSLVKMLYIYKFAKEGLSPNTRKILLCEHSSNIDVETDKHLSDLQHSGTGRYNIIYCSERQVCTGSSY